MEANDYAYAAVSVRCVSLRVLGQDGGAMFIREQSQAHIKACTLSSNVAKRVSKCACACQNAVTNASPLNDICRPVDVQNAGAIGIAEGSFTNLSSCMLTDNFAEV